MARAQHKKAGKDYPELGIVKGTMYWYADVKTGPRSKIIIRSKDPIPRSRLTGSAFLSSAYDLSDRCDKADTLEELEDIKSGFEDLGQECQDSLDNMPEGLQQGATGELLQERIDQCESMVSELEDAISYVEEKQGDASDGGTGDEEDAEHDGEEELSEAELVRAAIEENVSSQF